MLTNQLNLNQLRVFESVFRLGSMTLAARELHLTQSGISQHIRSLEETLKVQLFERVKKRVVPTPQATLLHEHCSAGFKEIEQALIALQGDKARFTGSVNIGIPPEFGNNIIIPLLAEFGKKHPDVQFHAVYGFASEMNQLLLKGELHFAFVDAFDLDRQIHTEKVFREVLWLCASKEYLKSKGKVKESREYFESLDYVSYVQGDTILTSWFRHHFEWKHPKLRIRATVKDVQGVARLITAGLGVGILPDHLVQKLIRETMDYHLFQGSGKPLENTISIAALQARSQSYLVRSLIDYLKSSLQTI